MNKLYSAHLWSLWKVVQGINATNVYMGDMVAHWESKVWIFPPSDSTEEAFKQRTNVFMSAANKICQLEKYIALFFAE